MKRLTMWDYFVDESVEPIEVKHNVFDEMYADSTIRSELTWLTQSMASMLDAKLEFEHGNSILSPTFLRAVRMESRLQHFNAVKFMAQNLVETYKDKWNKIYSALIGSTYNPLENYNMEQVETPDITKERNSSTATKLTTSSSGESANETHGFNSSVAVPTDANESSSETTTEGLADDNHANEVETETGTRELTRHGNIGVTTSQQMLESEIELRQRNNFYEMLVKDALKLLCVNIY